MKVSGEVRAVAQAAAEGLVQQGLARYLDKIPEGYLPPGFETKERRPPRDA